MHTNLEYTLPNSVEEWFVKGSFDPDGDGIAGTVDFEIPAVFDSNGVCDEAATIAKINEFVDYVVKSLQARAATLPNP